MNKTLCAIAVLGLAFGAAGCSTGKSNTYGATSNDVTDLSTPSAATATPAYTPAPAPQPVVYDSMTTTPISTAMTGGNYTVKKGDTLYGIARQHYGDGKQWQKIASANPGLKPSALRVGQQIVLP